MKEVSVLRKEAKKFIDKAGDKTVKMIHAMLEVDQQTDWWDDLSEDAKASIEKGVDDVKKGKVKPHAEVMKKYQKWLSK